MASRRPPRPERCRRALAPPRLLGVAQRIPRRPRLGDGALADPRAAPRGRPVLDRDLEGIEMIRTASWSPKKRQPLRPPSAFCSAESAKPQGAEHEQA